MSPSNAGQPKRSTPRAAVGPRLRVVFHVVLALVALLGVNSIYLASITLLEWISRQWGAGVGYEDQFYLSMFAVHLALGLVLITPFLVFGVLHLLIARGRRNRQAVRLGYALFGVSVALLASGVLLIRLEGLIDLKHPTVRSVVYWVHVLCPLAMIWLYWLHRLAGSRIHWNVAKSYAALLAVAVIGMVAWQTHDPRRSQRVPRGEEPVSFEPSRIKTASGGRIAADSLMMDDYCKKCHPDAYEGWFHSVHHFSSFNNPAYRATIRQTRYVATDRHGDASVTRLCAGCHDPVPLLSGAFDQPSFDDVNDPTSQAGITCTVCHSVTSIDSTVGNGDCTIEEPRHYPFAYSENPILQYINNQLVKAKPAFHKRTFLKPFHQSAEFCSVCHKVHLPKAVTEYKEFLRGQNHYDSFLLSGVSGVGARSFYYPPTAESNCNGCHMPPEGSNDFGAKPFDGSGELQIHGHLFPSANTAIAHLRGKGDIVKAHQDFLEGTMRVDVFGIKDGGGIGDPLSAPLRPEVPALRPGGRYLLEAVIRTLKMGHFFTQGTTDSNQIWLDVTVTSGDRVIGRSGARDRAGRVDPWSHFVNVFMLDRDGNRVSRRDTENIFVPLYNHQIPPGAGQVVHYDLAVPNDVTEPIVVDVKLQYRKFDWEYMRFVTGSGEDSDRSGEQYVNDLPVTTLAEDRITFSLVGNGLPVKNETPKVADWERWNDYGIGLLLEGNNAGARGELRQAADAFAQVEQLQKYHGPLNLARVYFNEGRLDEAVEAANRAAAYPDAPAWTIAWLSGMINKQQGYLEEAIANFRSVLEDRTPEMARRKFDFSRDYVVINQLGLTLFERAKQFRGDRRRAEREELLAEAARQFERTLAIDSENVTAHFNLYLLYAQLGDKERAAEHQKLHARYKPDDNARDRAIALARQRYPAANHAAEPLVIYSLSRAVEEQSAIESTPAQEVTVEVRSWGDVQQMVADAAGKVVVVDLWSSWCVPCQKEFPGLVKLCKQFPDQVACISVNLDYIGLPSEPPEASRETVLEFLHAQNATFQNVISSDADEDVLKRLGLGAVPIVLVYAPDGSLAKSFHNDDNEYGEDGFTYQEDIAPFVRQLLASRRD